MTTTLERDDAEAIDDELTQVASAAIHGALAVRGGRLLKLDRWDRYRRGKAGIPEVPEGSSDEITEIANLSPMNMCGVVVSTFVHGLVVEGYRSPDSKDDEPAWKIWQTNGLDARQTEVHDGANTYGWSFASVLPESKGADEGKPRIVTWSPKDVEAVYDDPRRDDFPTSATLFREVEGGWSVLLVDTTHVRSGFIPRKTNRKGKAKTPDEVQDVSEPWAHGATYRGQAVCPVIRFMNELPADDCDPRGEVEPLIHNQRAMNSVNFDRLVASRSSVFEQKVIIGWAASKEQTLKASASRVWAFEDHPSDLSVQSLPSSPITPYNELLREMKEQVALEASIPIYQATGSVANVSENTVAMVDNAYQLKLRAKRDLLGEAWERVLRVAVAMDGGEEPSESAEVVWRDTRPRSTGVVADGISKLVAAGVPVEELLELVPDFSQQKVDAIRNELLRSTGLAQIDAITAAIREAPAAPMPASPTGAAVAAPADTSALDDAAVLKAKFDALGVAVRAGVKPEYAAKMLGLEGIELTGAVPTSLKMPGEDAGGEVGA